MGVCKNCENLPIQIPEHHHLQKLHDLTEEYKTYWSDIEQKAPGWNSCSVNNDKLIFKFFENAENLSLTDFQQKCVFDEEYRKTHRREYIIENFNGKTCTCCD